MFKRLSKKTCCIIILMSVTFQCYSTEVKSIITNDLKWPPFFFPIVENARTGFGREVLDLCLKQMNYQTKYRALPLKRISMYMESGDLDISTFSHHKKREEFIVYGKEPLFISEYGVASKKSANLIINSIEDIKKYTLGHLAGLAHTQKIRKILEDKRKVNEVSTGYDIDFMFGQLLAKPQRFQVMLNSKETLAWRGKQLNILDKVKIHDIIVKQKPYYVTVSKKSKNIKNIPHFLGSMDECLIKLKANGTYSKLASFYQLNTAP